MLSSAFGCDWSSRLGFQHLGMRKSRNVDNIWSQGSEKYCIVDNFWSQGAEKYGIVDNFGFLGAQTPAEYAAAGHP